MSYRKNYHEIFVASYGDFPHPCYFCGEVVDAPAIAEARIVHHIDEDWTNDDPENLAPGHRGCHSTYHSKRRVPSAETRAKISAAGKGKPKPSDFSAKISAANRGRIQSSATRKKLRAAQIGKKASDETKAKMSAVRKGRPSPNKGKRLTPEAKARLSAVHKARCATPEARAKLSAAAKARWARRRESSTSS